MKTSLCLLFACAAPVIAADVPLCMTHSSLFAARIDMGRRLERLARKHRDS